MYQKDKHYSEELERAIIGACLIEKSAFGRIYGILRPDIFYSPDHQVIFDCIEKMWEENLPVEYLSVTLKLIKNGFTEFKDGPTQYYIPRCTREVVSTANLEYWGLLLREMYIEREMLKITHSGMKDQDTWEFMDALQEKMIHLRQVKAINDFKAMDEVVVNLLKHMDAVKSLDMVGITSGFKKIDRGTGGFMPGGMYIIGARPRIGKSAFMGKVVLEQAKRGIKSAIMSLEMEEKQIAARLSSLVSDVEYSRIYRNIMADEQQRQQCYDRMHLMGKLPILISDTASVDMNDIKAKVAKLKQQNQIDILYIDYLQLIETTEARNRTREQEVSKLSRGLKILAKDFKIPVIVLAQLNRLTEDNKERKPRLHNLRESGSLEQDADGVIFLHSDFKSGIKTNPNTGNSTEGEADIIVAKWRDGEEGEFKIGFDGPRMKFYELDEVQNSFTPFRQIRPAFNPGNVGDEDEDLPF